LTSTATNIDLAVYESWWRRFTFKHIDPSWTNSTVLTSSNWTLFEWSIDYTLSSNWEFVTIVFDWFEWLRIA
jgi:hypothetical protein